MMCRAPEGGLEIPKFINATNAHRPNLSYKDHPRRSMTGVGSDITAKSANVGVRLIEVCTFDPNYFIRGTLLTSCKFSN